MVPSLRLVLAEMIIAIGACRHRAARHYDAAHGGLGVRGFAEHTRPIEGQVSSIAGSGPRDCGSRSSAWGLGSSAVSGASASPPTRSTTCWPEPGPWVSTLSTLPSATATTSPRSSSAPPSTTTERTGWWRPSSATSSTPRPWGSRPVTSAAPHRPLDPDRGGRPAGVIGCTDRSSRHQRQPARCAPTRPAQRSAPRVPPTSCMNEFLHPTGGRVRRAGLGDLTPDYFATQAAVS